MEKILVHAWQTKGNWNSSVIYPKKHKSLYVFVSTIPLYISPLPHYCGKYSLKVSGYFPLLLERVETYGGLVDLNMYRDFFIRVNDTGIVMPLDLYCIKHQSLFSKGREYFATYKLCFRIFCNLILVHLAFGICPAVTMTKAGSGV